MHTHTNAWLPQCQNTAQCIWTVTQFKDTLHMHSLTQDCHAHSHCYTALHIDCTRIAMHTVTQSHTTAGLPHSHTHTGTGLPNLQKAYSVLPCNAHSQSHTEDYHTHITCILTLKIALHTHSLTLLQNCHTCKMHTQYCHALHTHTRWRLSHSHMHHTYTLPHNIAMHIYSLTLLQNCCTHIIYAHSHWGLPCTFMHAQCTCSLTLAHPILHSHTVYVSQQLQDRQTRKTHTIWLPGLPGLPRLPRLPCILALGKKQSHSHTCTLTLRIGIDAQLTLALTMKWIPLEPLRLASLF